MTREPELAGQTVIVIGGSAGMGLETARRAREEGAEVILTGRNAEHLKQAAADVGARDVAAFDATDPAVLGSFFAGLRGPVDHMMVTGPGPYYALLGRPRPRAGDPRFRRAPVAGHRGRLARRRPGAARGHAAVHAPGDPACRSWPRSTPRCPP